MNKLYAFPISLGFLFGLSAGALAEDALGKIQGKGVLAAGVRDDAPPFAFSKDGSGHIIGHDVDYLAAIAKRLGVRLELRPVSQANLLSELVSGRVDIVAANLTKNATRGKIIELSDPYLVTGQKLLVKAGTINSLQDLEGKKIGAVIGTPSEGCAQLACPGGTILRFDDYVEGVRALQTGRIDAFTTDEAILVDLLASLPRGDYQIPEVRISQAEYVFGMREGEKSLAGLVNHSIRELQQSGEAKKIYEKWFVPREERAPAAYGAIVRKAATPPRFLAVALNGVLLPKAEVSIFALNGNHVGKGEVSNVLGDQLYLDVDPSIYLLIQPGFLVTMNMSTEMARDVVIEHRDLLKKVKDGSEAEAEKFRAQIEKEGLEKAKRAEEADMLAEQNRLAIERERASYYDAYYYSRRFR